MLGASGTGIADGLRIWICVRPSGGTIAQPHAIDWLDPQSAPGTLATYPITDTFTGLSGTYDVGLCGRLVTSTTAWNVADWAYTTAEVIGGA